MNQPLGASVRDILKAGGGGLPYKSDGDARQIFLK